MNVKKNTAENFQHFVYLCLHVFEVLEKRNLSIAFLSIVSLACATIDDDNGEVYFIRKYRDDDIFFPLEKVSLN